MKKLLHMSPGIFKLKIVADVKPIFGYEYVEFYIFISLLCLGRLRFPQYVTLTPNYLQPDLALKVIHCLMANGL